MAVSDDEGADNSEEMDGGGSGGVGAGASNINRRLGRPTFDDVHEPEMNCLTDVEAKKAADFRKEKNRLSAKLSRDGRRLAQARCEDDDKSPEELRNWPKFRGRLMAATAHTFLRGSNTRRRRAVCVVYVK